MTMTCLRFATACGMSDRLRLDLVLNDFVACAVASGEITVLSDGTPWRPLIDVRDMARAIEWAIRAAARTAARFSSSMSARDDWNYQVSDLAKPSPPRARHQGRASTPRRRRTGAPTRSISRCSRAGASAHRRR